MIRAARTILAGCCLALLSSCAEQSPRVVVDGIDVRYRQGVSKHEAESVGRIFRRHNPSTRAAEVSVWRESNGYCVGARAYDGGYRTRSELPRLAHAISRDVFAGSPSCVGFEGDSLVTFPRECTDPGLGERDCPGMTAAGDYRSAVMAGGSDV